MPHRVHVADRELSFTIADGETVLAAGLRQGLALPFGCQSGGCGSCRVHMLAGEVEYPFAPPALSEAEIEAGYILMCLARPKSDLTLKLHQPPGIEELRPRVWPARVQRCEMLNHDVIGLWLTLPKGETFRYLPGQYVDFLIGDGKRRSFSIANAAGGIELHIRVTPGGQFAHYVVHRMPERAILRFEGPLGAFYVREDSARPVLLMAGGTGFAPVKAMLEDQLPRARSRSFHLFWGARARRDLYLDELARDWAEAYSNFRYTPVLSEPDTDWAGETGFVHEALLRHYPNLAGHEAYLSGPPVMVRAGKKAFTAAGLDADHLFYDSFDYAYETWPEAG